MIKEKIAENEFSKWTKWENRNSLEGIKFPGIYCIAISENDLSNDFFDWILEINYIGMTNSQNGLKGRLQQFDNTAKGKNGHGGADRFMYKYPDFSSIVSNLFVSVKYFECTVKSNEPSDLLVMGDVAKYEYVCFAEYAKRFKLLPIFNDKSNAPKFSLMNRKLKDKS